MGLKLISATPQVAILQVVETVADPARSPYARKVRVALAEKNIPFELVTEVPWDSTTATPQWNPLEKLPVLIDTEAQDEEDRAVYESAFILDWIEIKFSPPQYPTLTPRTKEGHLFAKKVQGMVANQDSFSKPGLTRLQSLLMGFVTPVCYCSLRNSGHHHHKNGLPAKGERWTAG